MLLVRGTEKHSGSLANFYGPSSGFDRYSGRLRTTVAHLHSIDDPLNERQVFGAPARFIFPGKSGLPKATIDKFSPEAPWNIVWTSCMCPPSAFRNNKDSPRLIKLSFMKDKDWLDSHKESMSSPSARGGYICICAINF